MAASPAPPALMSPARYSVVSAHLVDPKVPPWRASKMVPHRLTGNPVEVLDKAAYDGMTECGMKMFTEELWIPSPPGIPPCPACHGTSGQDLLTF